MGDSKGMRRKGREITDFQEILEVMKRCRVCHVGFHSEGTENYHFHREVVPCTAVLRLKVESLSARRRKVGLP